MNELQKLIQAANRRDKIAKTGIYSLFGICIVSLFVWTVANMLHYEPVKPFAWIVLFVSGLISLIWMQIDMVRLYRDDEAITRVALNNSLPWDEKPNVNTLQDKGD